MTDREMVIQHFQDAIEASGNGTKWRFVRLDIIEKAISLLNEQDALLKEQEPALPTWSQGRAYCGKCGHRLPRKRAGMEINYCGYCGQKVKWNDT